MQTLQIVNGQVRMCMLEMVDVVDVGLQVAVAMQQSGVSLGVEKGGPSQDRQLSSAAASVCAAGKQA